MDYYQSYVDLKLQEENIREEKKKLEEQHLSPLQKALADIVIKKDEMKEKMLADMEKKGIKTKELEHHLISTAEKRTISVVDEVEAINDMIENPDIQRKLSRLTGKTKTELRSLLIKTSLNNKEAVPLAENLFKTENVLPKGIEEKVTTYPIVKEK